MSSTEGESNGWRAPLNQLEFTTLRVADLDAAVDWYTSILDLQVVDQRDDAATLTCGGDGYVDLALRRDADGPGRGMESLSFGIESPAAVDELESALQERGTATERVEDDLTGFSEVLQIQPPTGAPIRVVATADRPTGVFHGTRPTGVAPLDAHHTTLATPDVKGYAEWLQSTLGFATSDAVTISPEAWLAAWTHITPQHHDIGLLASEEPDRTVHHIAFLAEDLNHMGEVADRVISSGEQRCEWGIGKHGGLGANNYLYVKDPSGNRVEINSNMDLNPFERPADIWAAEEFLGYISLWTHEPPPADFNTGT